MRFADKQSLKPPEIESGPAYLRSVFTGSSLIARPSYIFLVVT